MSHKHNTQTFHNGWFIPFQFWFHVIILRHQAGWGHAMAQVSSDQPNAAQTQDKSQASTHEISGGQNLVFLSASFHQCKRFIHLSMTLYNHRNQWHCQRTSLKNMAGWCRGHILDMYSEWTWIKQWLWQWVSWLEIFRGFPQCVHAQLPV